MESCLVFLFRQPEPCDDEMEQVEQFSGDELVYQKLAWPQGRLGTPYRSLYRLRNLQWTTKENLY